MAARLEEKCADLVLTDLKMPGMRSEALLRQVRTTFPGIPVIARTALGSLENAVALTCVGARTT
jgi:DNA-binding NtrC family response regulator